MGVYSSAWAYGGTPSPWGPAPLAADGLGAGAGMGCTARGPGEGRALPQFSGRDDWTSQACVPSDGVTEEREVAGRPAFSKVMPEGEETGGENGGAGRGHPWRLPRSPAEKRQPRQVGGLQAASGGPGPLWEILCRPSLTCLGLTAFSRPPQTCHSPGTPPHLAFNPHWVIPMHPQPTPKASHDGTLLRPSTGHLRPGHPRAPGMGGTQASPIPSTRVHLTL